MTIQNNRLIVKISECDIFSAEEVKLIKYQNYVLKKEIY